MDREFNLRMRMVGNFVPEVRLAEHTVEAFTGKSLAHLKGLQLGFTAMGVAVSGAFLLMAKQAYDFDKSLLNLRVTSQMTTSEFVNFKDVAFAAAKSVGRNVDEIVSLSTAFRAAGGDITVLSQHLGEATKMFNMVGGSADEFGRSLQGIVAEYDNMGQAFRDLQTLYNIQGMGGNKSGLETVQALLPRFLVGYEGAQGTTTGAMESAATLWKLGPRLAERATGGLETFSNQPWANPDSINRWLIARGKPGNLPADASSVQLAQAILTNVQPGERRAYEKMMFGRRGTVAMEKFMEAAPGAAREFNSPEAQKYRAEENEAQMRRQSLEGKIANFGNDLKNYSDKVGPGGALALAGGGLLTAAGLSKILGGTAALPRGLAEGFALRQLGITPVYVVNFGEIGGSNNLLKNVETGASGGLAAGAAWLLSKISNVDQYASSAIRYIQARWFHTKPQWKVPPGLQGTRKFEDIIERAPLDDGAKVLVKSNPWTNFSGLKPFARGLAGDALGGLMGVPAGILTYAENLGEPNFSGGDPFKGAVPVTITINNFVGGDSVSTKQMKIGSKRTETQGFPKVLAP